MPYSLNSISDDCYENSSVLINKFNIRDEKQLDIMEQGLTAVLIAKAQTEIPFENVDFDFYKKLHKYVFGDIYDWAGTVRIINISKGETAFCPAEQIPETADRIFNHLKSNNFLKDLKNSDFVSEFTDLYCNLNYLHPFREGNGRIERLFLTMLISNAGRTFNFSEIDRDLLMIATIKSANGDIFLLKDIFQKHIKQ